MTYGMGVSWRNESVSFYPGMARGLQQVRRWMRTIFYASWILRGRAFVGLALADAALLDGVACTYMPLPSSSSV